MFRQDREMLEEILDSVTDAIFVLDMDGRFLGINRTAHERLGYSREEMLSMRISDLDPPEYAAKVPERLDLLRREGQAVFESAHVRKDGTVMPVEVNSRILQLDGRQVFLSVIRDIAARKEAELALKRNELELSSVYDNMPVMLLLLDGERRIRKMNRHAVEMSAKPERESTGLRGGDALRCVRAEEDPRGCGYGKACEECVLRLAVADTVSTGTSYRRIEASIPYRKDGGESLLWVLVTTSLLRLPHEQLVMVCMEDITRLKEAEKSLKTYTGQLEYSNKMKDLFADIVSHDLINPANIIHVMSKRLLEGEGCGRENELSMIARNAERMLGLIADASTFARMESLDKVETHEQDLVVILSAAIERLQPLAAKAEVRILFDPEREAPLQANSAVEDVFVNILSNAIKYSPPDSEVRVGITEDENCWLVATADRGEGIPDEFKPVVFERFTRGGKEGIEGSGLGLAIVQRVVELHRGSIRIEDNPGGGSIFTVQLPKGSPAADSSGVQHAPGGRGV